MKKAIYIDMDGTLARFHDADKQYIEAMWTQGFYVNLEPFENLVKAVRLFKERNPDVPVYVLSAYLDTEPPFVVGEKNAWVDKHLPEIDLKHRIFTRAGDDKSKYIDMESAECYLIDDFNKNLYEFETAGGTGIKFRNDVNHRGLGEYGGSKGSVWPGELVSYNNSPEKICAYLESVVLDKVFEYEEDMTMGLSVEEAVYRFACNCHTEDDFRQMLADVHAEDNGFAFEIGARCWVPIEGSDKWIMVEHQITTVNGRDEPENDEEADFLTAYLVANEKDTDCSHELGSICIDNDISLAELEKEMIACATEVSKELILRLKDGSVEDRIASAVERSSETEYVDVLPEKDEVL